VSFYADITVGSSTFTDLFYTDDTAMLVPSVRNAAMAHIIIELQ